MVEGTINSSPFPAALEPNGEGSHWLRVNKTMRDAAGANGVNTVTVEITRAGEEPELRVPTDLRKAIAAAPLAQAGWNDITPMTRRSHKPTPQYLCSTLARITSKWPTNRPQRGSYFLAHTHAMVERGLPCAHFKAYCAHANGELKLECALSLSQCQTPSSVLRAGNGFCRTRRNQGRIREGIATGSGHGRVADGGTTERNGL
jgi:hypothetical protein